MRGVFLYTLPFNRPQRKKSAGVRSASLLSLNFLTNFWMQHFDGARLSTNSVRNAVWHALNEPVCQYLRRRNPRCSTVYIDNSLGPPARDSSSRKTVVYRYMTGMFQATKFSPCNFMERMCFTFILRFCNITSHHYSLLS